VARRATLSGKALPSLEKKAERWRAGMKGLLSEEGIVASLRRGGGGVENIDKRLRTALDKNNKKKKNS